MADSAMYLIIAAATAQSAPPVPPQR